MAKEEQAKSLRERVGECEQVVTLLDAFVKQVMQRLGETLMTIGEQIQQLRQQDDAFNLVLEALEGMFADGVLRTRIDTLVVARAEAALNQALTEGRAAVTETVGPGTFLVGLLYGADGQIRRPGRVEMRFDSLNDDLKGLLHGKKATEEVLHEGERMVVTAVYAYTKPGEAATSGLVDTSSAAAPDAE